MVPSSATKIDTWLLHRGSYYFDAVIVSDKVGSRLTEPHVHISIITYLHITNKAVSTYKCFHLRYYRVTSNSESLEDVLLVTSARSALPLLNLKLSTTHLYKHLISHPYFIAWKCHVSLFLHQSLYEFYYRNKLFGRCDRFSDCCDHHRLTEYKISLERALQRFHFVSSCLHQCLYEFYYRNKPENRRYELIHGCCVHHRLIVYTASLKRALQHFHFVSRD